MQSLDFPSKINCFNWCFFVSGVFESQSVIDFHCVVYGILAAIGFVSLVLCNKRIKNIKPLDKTIVQLFVSAITVLPYVIINDSFPKTMDTTTIIIVLVLGIVHTGVAYILYFNSIDVLSSDKIAILGYVEPVLSILTGALIFKEKLTILGIFGAIMILVSALMNELLANK